MKGLKKFWSAVLIALICTGCTATRTVVTEYGADGKVVKTTETGESVVKTLTESTKNKTVVVWESGWAAYLSCSTATVEDPSPTFKMFAGKTDKGMISALPGQQNWDGIANAINATKYELSVSKDGISAGSAGTATTAATGKVDATEAKAEAEAGEVQK